MPWFPDFSSAVELARRQTQAAGRADPVAQYFTALNHGDTHVLETVWPGEVVVYDPRAGEIRGHKKLREFVSTNKSFFAERHARTETVASTVVGGRAVVELTAHLIHDGREVAWPVAVVATHASNTVSTMRCLTPRFSRRIDHWNGGNIISPAAATAAGIRTIDPDIVERSARTDRRSPA